jgi:peroxiredoxin
VELPRLQPLFEKYQDQGFNVIAVEAYRDTKRAQKLIEDKALTYTFLENGEDDSEVVQSQFGVRWYPTSFVIDREGRIMYAHVGFEPGDEVALEQEIQSLL